MKAILVLIMLGLFTVGIAGCEGEVGEDGASVEIEGND